MGVIAIVKSKRYIAATYILYIIIGKLNYYKESSLIILLVVNKNPKVNFYLIVLPLYLAISLRMKDGEEPLFDLQEVTK